MNWKVKRVKKILQIFNILTHRYYSVIAYCSFNAKDNIFSFSLVEPYFVKIKVLEKGLTKLNLQFD